MPPAPALRRRTAPLGLMLGCLLSCARPVVIQRPQVPQAERPPAPPPQTAATRLLQMERELDQLSSLDKTTYENAYRVLAQRALDGDQAARTVQLVFTLRDSLREGCTDPADQQGFAQQLDLLQLHLAKASPEESVFAGPSLLLGLHAVGRAAEMPARVGHIVQLARAVLATDPARLGALLCDLAHALRLGCQLKQALPLLEEAVTLSGKGPEKGRSLGAQLARKDLATLRFLFGDAQSAQQDLLALHKDLLLEDPTAAPKGPAEASLEARKEVVEVLLLHLVDVRNQASQASQAPQATGPRETGPGWQALRMVQQEASCAEATPADPHMVRVPVPLPSCAPPVPEAKSPG